MTYIILAIPCVFAAFLIFMLSRQRRSDKAFRMLMADMDREIDNNYKRLETVSLFIKTGYRKRPGETVTGVGNGYLIVNDGTGVETVVLPPGATMH